MKKHILAAAACIAAITVPAFARDNNTFRVPFDIPLGEHEPAVREIDVAALKSLVAAAEENGDKTAFVGNPTVWATDGEISKRGVYLTDGGSIVIQPGKK